MASKPALEVRVTVGNKDIAANGMTFPIPEGIDSENAKLMYANFCAHQLERSLNIKYEIIERKGKEVKGSQPFQLHPPVVTAHAGKRGARYGAFNLTKREYDVAVLLAKGLSNRSIAHDAGLQEQSVKNLVSVIMRKMNCENRVQVALKLTGNPPVSIEE